MPFLQLSGIRLSFGARDLILNASLNLQDGSRAALTGPNGAGKSTLMKIAVGLVKPDAGEVIATKDTRIAYLPQTGVQFESGTVYEIAEAAFAFDHDLIKEQEEIGRLLDSSHLSEKETKRLIARHHEITEKLEQAEYWNRGERISEVLNGLDFKIKDFGRSASELSGGWQMRLALAKILLEEPDIMLLDEPTNYLDLEARTWLEDFLKAYPGAVLVVSHDRYFLDVTVREVYELFNGCLTRYVGTYSQYEMRRSQELEALFEAWERQQEERQRIEDFIRRFRYKDSKAAQVQSRIKMLEKMTPIEIPEGMKRIHFSFPPAPRSPRVVLRIHQLSRSYGELRVIEPFSLEVERGQKLALVGPNGAGKSTLMRIIAKEDNPTSGEAILGANVLVGYFSQESAEIMESTATVKREAESVCPPEMLPKIRNLLGAFLFRDDDIDKPISVLSGGERSRLALLKLLLKPANLLVLDEPTNHLDLTSKDILLEALSRFEGTVILVSHDRQFLDELPDRSLELSCGNRPLLYYGNYAYYLTKKAEKENAKLEAMQEDNQKPKQRRQSETDSASSVMHQELISDKNWETEKARKARLRKLKRREEDISTRIEEIQTEKEKLQEELAQPRNYINGEKTRRILAELEDLDRETEALNEEWLEIAQSLSEEA